MHSTRAAAPKSPWFEVGLVFLSSRMLIACVGWLSTLIVAKGKFDGGEAGLLEIFARWDAGWFVGIAQGGYSYSPGNESSVAFFPLYPMAIRLLEWLPGGAITAGFLISNAAFLAALVLLRDLLENDAIEGGNAVVEGDGIRAVRLMAFGPVSFFFSTIYSESLFLFLVLLCIHAARRGSWAVAGLAGLGAALTRNAGLLLVAPLLCEYFDLRLRAPFLRRPRPIAGALWCLMPLGGIVLWALFLFWRFGDAMLFLKVQAAWGRHLTWPWVPFSAARLHDFPAFHQWWFTGHALVGLSLLLVGWRLGLRPSYLVLGTLMLLLNFSATHLEAIPRLLSVIFPLYVGAACVARRWPAVEIPILCISAGLLALSTVLFANGYWFT